MSAPKLKRSEVVTVTLEKLRKEFGNNLLPFVRPTLHMHESGFRTFQVGYCSADGKKEAVITESSDHVYWDEPMMSSLGARNPSARQPSLSMDLDTTGRIRFYRGFLWRDDLGLSTMMLKYVGEFKDQ